MERFPEFESDVEFARGLIVEQNVFCLPGTVSSHTLNLFYCTFYIVFFYCTHTAQGFITEDCFRIVLGCGEEKMKEAAKRIAEFAKQHYKQ